MLVSFDAPVGHQTGSQLYQLHSQSPYCPKLNGGRAHSLRVNCQQAVRKALVGLPLHRLSSGHFTVPVLQPEEDDLPFSMSLDLYRSLDDAPSSAIESRPEEGLYSLQYILDGSGQLVKARGATEQVQPGDSILAPHGHTYIQVPGSSPGQDADSSSSSVEHAWQMASITLLLPKDLIAATERSRASSSKKAETAVKFGNSSSSTAGVLSASEAARIVAGARETARAATKARSVPATLPTVPQQLTGSRPSFEQEHISRDSTAKAFHPYVGTQKMVVEATMQHDQSQALHEEAESCSNASLGGFAQYRSLPVSETGEREGDTAGADSLKNTIPAASAASRADEQLDNRPLESKGARHGALETVRAFLQSLARWRHDTDGGKSEVLKRALSELNAFRLPHQTNRLALIFDPLDDHVNFTFGVEIFEPGHRTTPHTHPHAHELFFIIAGEGEGFCDKERFPLAAGDVVVFPPGSEHGIDVADGSKMYCLEIMQPNDMFAELVRAGAPAGNLLDDDLCIMIATGCSGA